MRDCHSSRSLAFQLVVALVTPALLIAPFGCQTVTLLLESAAGDRFGWFVNEDKTSTTLFGARSSDESEVFAYGSFDADGNIERITDVVVRDADGNESFMSLDDDGRPLHLEAADGSYAHMFYTEITPERLSGTVQLYMASDQSKQDIPFDVDLTESLANILAELEQLTGLDLDAPPNPEARTVAPAGRQVGRNQQTILVPIFLVPFVVMTYATSLIAAAIMRVVLNAVAAAVQLTVLAVFAPFFILAAVTNSILFLPIRTVALLALFSSVPGVPFWQLL